VGVRFMVLSVGVGFGLRVRVGFAFTNSLVVLTGIFFGGNTS